MQVSVARQVEGRTGGPIAAWALLGFGLGTVAGFLLGELFGTGGHRRMRGLVRRRGRTQGPDSSPLSRVRESLAADPALAAEPLEVRPRGRNVELRGWVSTRSSRARAYRAARAAAQPAEVVNHLRVVGEDDRATAASADSTAPQSASA